MKKRTRSVQSNHSFWKFGFTALGGTVVLGACTTYEDQYARLYDACDQRAGVCYQKCDSYSYEQGRDRCQSDCSYEADRCFGDIARLAEQDSAYYARSNFYGRYGAWYPSSGYRYGPHGYPFSYSYGSSGYGGYGRGYGGYGYDRDRDRDRDRRDDDEGDVVKRSTGKPNNPNPKSLPKLPIPSSEPPTKPTGKPNAPQPSVGPNKPNPPPATKPPSKPAGKTPSKPRKPLTKPNQPPKQDD